MSDSIHFDIVVIGSGPAGQKAACTAAQYGSSVALIEREVSVGGACVHRGTIPSKTLRETALSLANFQKRTGGVFKIQVNEELQVASLMARMEGVIRAHAASIEEEMGCRGIQQVHGRARFLSPTEVEVTTVSRAKHRIAANAFIIATGSHPRTPANVPIDHQHVLDSDSILSMIYLPKSLAVLGAGVIACEYASIFAALGVQVTIVDKSDRPLRFLDPELTDRYVGAFERAGGRFIGCRAVDRVEWDGVNSVVTHLDDGTELRTEKLLCCLGREANLEGLEIATAGLTQSSRGLLAVDENFQTAVPNIYAVGDVIGPPSLASTSMDQGRRAVCHALGRRLKVGAETIPAGIYTIPEMSSVGISEAEANAKHGSCLVGRATFDELARGQIAAIPEGMLKLVADARGERVLGVQIIGEGASELIHLGQLALVNGNHVDAFVDNVFNFPTLAEAYRIAAMDVVWQRAELLQAAAT